MPCKILVALLVSLATVLPARSEVKPCPSTQAPGWSEQLRQLFPECENDVPSPDGKLKFHIGGAEKFSVLSGGRPLTVVGRDDLPLPAVISWSPRSDMFFVNDGGGSGLSSKLRLFDTVGSSVKEYGVLNNSVRRTYRTRIGCSRSASNPNVYGVGWSSDGKKLYAIAQATVNAPCGYPADYLGFVVDATTHGVVSVLTAAQAKAAFGQLLPAELQ